ncbi:isoaspartyl peptidase/L-asparaginase [Hyalangium sp.]|uniref:isoaspartyl peptidase/L-asparaginase family protein n=1 Tax=Hyalangium sp. TaxID=2028555 RepID=UPI002D73E1C2|nr:isoaspartyl peptidase/L-asparaginase [Hyalangium sp.]HYH96281.1 isoaspartyl peptidase/L-asparaginase [Hyalangium sp.]
MPLLPPSCWKKLLTVAALPALLMTPLGCASQEAATKDDAARAAEAAPSGPVKWGIVVHGGLSGPDKLPPDQDAAYRAKLTEALQAGHALLARGGTSLDAVSVAVRILEDSPLFNAGKGAVFNHTLQNELDASIMDGKTRKAGAVAGLHHVKNPIELARKVMEKSPHVMMVGDGAEAFAKEQGVELVPAEYFRTEEKWQEIQQILEAEKKAGQSGVFPAAGDKKYGTVGAVALDQAGNLAAGTSTGGMVNKRYGRVGDSPIIGAGTYADTRCGVSSTGHGEYFIRYTVARDVCARLEYQGIPLKKAADAVVMDVLVKAGGVGGVIAMDAQGNVATPYNSPGMFRGYMGGDGVARVSYLSE